MNWPNRLTMLRVFMIPFFVALMFLTSSYTWCRYAAAGVFIAACLTDLLDGKIARKYNLVTDFGKFMDPLADKLLVVSALIVLVFLNIFTEEQHLFHAKAENIIFTVAVLLIVAREFIISGFRLVAAGQGLVLAASKTAKVKTTFQMIMIVALILHFNYLPFLILEWVLILASLVLTVWSLIEYLVKNASVLKDVR
jgi:CDP-diacylglycerol--glycerol-3-phosphate 3-phosphatidyltransferase